MKLSRDAHADTILLVDDETLMRQGIRSLIEREGNIAACEDVARESAALRVITKRQPDLLIVGLAAGRAIGIGFLKRVIRRFPALKTLVLCSDEEIASAERALRAGAMGLVMKQESSTVLIQAIRTVLAGDVHISEPLSKRLLGERVRPTGGGGRPKIEQLSDREIETLSLIGRGFGTSEIAAKMQVSVHTIETFRARIRKKLQIKTGNDLMRYAIEWTRHPDR